MSAASPATSPFFREATEFWDELVDECSHETESINACVSQHGLPTEGLVKWTPGAEIHMSRSSYPSTTVQARFEFFSWGPMISGTVTGQQDDDLNFAPEWFDILVAKDLDGATVGILGEGRSFTARELATYLTQHFRRCFPGISLPYRTSNV
ncbi:MAG: hypothetical protein JO145_09875 [Acidobacteriaceae bacterium]|nr:hypothetical protein [Acidobacteriaceae bacterium]MBV9766978.1 hypothetical protein [Acidobacteriaceae bacterium]